MFFFSQEANVTMAFIQPGKPTQNAFLESSNARRRDGCSNQHWFRGLHEARETIEPWRQQCDEVRPHSSHGYTPPAQFEKETA